MSPSVVLLLPAKSYRADDFFAAAQTLGVEVVVASDRCHQLAELWPASGASGSSGLQLTQTLPLPFREPLRAARELVASLGARLPAAIVGVDDLTSVIAARASELCGLAHNPVEAVEAARNKGTARERLREAGVPGPWFEVVPRDLDDAGIADLAAAAPYPCVVKPLVLSASRGVIRANGPAQLIAAFARVRALLQSPQIAERREPALSLILVEEFLPGSEIALEGLLSRRELRVLAVFDKPDPLDGPFFEETLYITPSRHSVDLQAAAAEMTASAARALGLVEGPLHAELRLTPEGPRVIEVAARSIGGLCGRTLRFGVGLSLEELLLRHALGLPLRPEREEQAAGVMMLPIPRRGVLKGFTGVEAAKAVPGVEDVIITAPLDEELLPLPEGGSYLGFAFARAATPAAVESALRQAQRCLSFELVTTLPTLPAAQAALSRSSREQNQGSD